MLGPMSDSLLVRLLFAIANFASTEMQENMEIQPDEWNILWLTVAFVAVRSSYGHLISEWKPATSTDAVAKDVVATFADANWTVVMYVIVQWGVDLIEGWWGLSESALIGFAVTEAPVIVLQALVVALSITDFGKRRSNAKAVETARNVTGQLNFSISFFVADRVSNLVDIDPEPALFSLAAVAFAAWYGTLNKLFAKWQPPEEDEKGQALKEIFEQNIKTVNTAGVLVLTSLGVDMFHTWWTEGEHWIVAASVFASVVFLVLSIAEWVSEYIADDDVMPDYMINRAIFSMSIFMANKAQEAGGVVDVEKTVWTVFWTAVAFIALGGSIHTVLDAWSRHIEHKIETLRADLGSLTLTEHEAKRLATRVRDARGDRILKNSVKRNVQTWITIVTIFITRWLVNIFVAIWKAEDDWIIGLPIVEASMLLLVAIVKVGQWYEGVYKEVSRPYGLA